MDKNTLIIRGSFLGILGDFIRNLLILIGVYVVYAIATDYKTELYTEKNIQSYVSYVMEFQDAKTIVILFSIFLLFFILAVFAATIVFKLINLIYETQKIVTIDFVSGKILAETYSFPLSKSVEEHKFNEIISVNINQSLTNRLFRSGDMYIDYLTCSKVDSKLRNLEVTFISQPEKIKPKMI